jgi:hypothetical protein
MSNAATASLAASLGATAALALGLTEEIDPTGKHVSCFSEVPRPDIIVAMSGCHYEYEGRQLDFDTSGWGNKEADLVLIAGEKDEECAAWQSQDAATELRSAGYDVDLLILDGANHYAPVFHDLRDGQFVVVADDPAGERTVEVNLMWPLGAPGACAARRAGDLNNVATREQRVEPGANLAAQAGTASRERDGCG